MNYITEKLIFLLMLVLLCSCTESDSNELDQIDELAVNQRRIDAPISADGSVAIEFQLQPGRTALQLVAQAPLRSLRLMGVVAPNSDVLFDAENYYDTASTQAADKQARVNVVNLPILGRSGLEPLQAGTYVALYATELLSTSPDQDLTADTFSLSIVTKADGDITQGGVPLRVVIPNSIADSEASFEALESALGVAADIFEGGGLDLQWRIVTDDTLPGTLPNPAIGDLFYEKYPGAGDSLITLFVGVNIEQLRGPLNTIAQAGSSPGAFVASARTGIAASLTAAAGSDQVIDSDQDQSDRQHTSEVRLLGEAIAHEVLHYLGLQDTLEFSGSTAIASDVTDSPKCPSLEACRIDPDAPHNIMFPYPLDRQYGNTVTRSQDRYIPREFLSDMQQVIAQAAIGVQ